MAKRPRPVPAIQTLTPDRACCVTLVLVDGRLYWEAVGESTAAVCTDAASVRVLPESRVLPRAMRNAFMQLLVNVLLVNRLALQAAGRFDILVEPRRIAFTYRLHVGESVHIPPLPPLPRTSVRFSVDARGVPALRVDAHAADT